MSIYSISEVKLKNYWTKFSRENIFDCCKQFLKRLFPPPTHEHAFYAISYPTLPWFFNAVLFAYISLTLLFNFYANVQLFLPFLIKFILWLQVFLFSATSLSWDNTYPWCKISLVEQTNLVLDWYWLFLNVNKFLLFKWKINTALRQNLT